MSDLVMLQLHKCSLQKPQQQLVTLKRLGSGEDMSDGGRHVRHKLLWVHGAHMCPHHMHHVLQKSHRVGALAELWLQWYGRLNGIEEAGNMKPLRALAL